MPQIRFKGVKAEEVAAISAEVVKEMAQIMDTPPDWFQVEFDPTQVLAEGRATQGEPMVQVWWFERGQQVQDRAAQKLNEIVKSLGYPYSVVSFHPFLKSAYYEDGEHF